MRSFRTLGYCFALLMLLNSACATGFNRKALEEQVGTVHAEFDERDIEKAYLKKPNLPKPFRLGVYFKAPASLRTAYRPRAEPAQDWRWTEDDRKMLTELALDLKKRGLVADVFPLLSSVVAGEDLKSLRLAAAKHQADAVLVISGAADVDRYANNWAVTYVLLAPTLFVPGSQADSLFLSSATLWDVKNEYLYMTAEAEGVAHDRYAAAFGKSDKELINDAKNRSLTNLKGEISRQLAGERL